jgi:hypothetical protein
MAGPKWGVFMSKVYADSKLPYGKVKEFAQPSEMKNDPINADGYIENLLEKSGETLNYEEGNDDGSDFFSEDPVQPQPSDNRFKDMNAPGREKPDTGSNKPSKPDK